MGSAICRVPTDRNPYRDLLDVAIRRVPHIPVGDKYL